MKHTDTNSSTKPRLVIVYRNGQEKLKVMAEVRNGVLRCGKNILINSDLITAPHTPSDVAASIKAGKITPEIEAMGMRIGDNGNGLVCRWAADVAVEEYNALPAEVRAAQEERAEISKLYAAAYRSETHDTDDNQMMRAMHQRGEADRRLAAWKIKYPEADKADQKAELIAKAEEKEGQAVSALTYDCDGSISPEMQQQRHDNMMTWAKELREQAAAI